MSRTLTAIKGAGCEARVARNWSRHLQQLRQHIHAFARVHNWDWALNPRWVVLPLVVDPLYRADGAEEIGDADRAVQYGRAVAVGAADDLATLDPSADQHSAPGAGPVVAAAAGALGRAAEFAHPHN